MKRLFIILMAGVVAGPSAFAGEQSILARITVYWPSGKGREVASSNGATLKNGHCAVDPNRIPYGSKVIFPDAACLAVDCGPAVISRLAARKSGRTLAERNALVIDRYFESRSQALAWAACHPHYMTVRVQDTNHKPEALPSKKVALNGGIPLPDPQPGPQREKLPADNSAFPPMDLRGGLFPAFFGTVLPRS
jgi:hypothetical protein